MVINNSENQVKGFKEFISEYILESKFFDILILFLVLISVTFVILENIPYFASKYWSFLVFAEWAFTIFFTLEYLLRIICAKKVTKYIFSFFGLIDLVAILPLYISVFIVSGEILQVVRLLRIIRIFSKLIRASHKMDLLSKSMLDLKHHLRDKEKLILFFRPSRKRMLFRYIFLFLIVMLAIVDIVYSFSYNFTVSGIPILFIISLIVIVFSFIYFMKTEYLIWSKRYAITNERLIYCEGILHGNFQSRTYNYITDISLHQSLFDKILNTGDLVISNAAGAGEEMKIIGINDPLQLKHLIDINIHSVQGRN